jgi:hypothetical protein
VDYELSKHARDVIEERQIQIAWIERALTAPAHVDLSREDPAAESRFIKIPEFGDRVLRVVVNKQVAPIRVVSVYFDRTMKGKL